MIIIDPGHGGSDPGAVRNGVRESDINLSVSRLLAGILRAEGFTVKMTRTMDVNPDFRERISGTVGAALFLSIHCNSVKDTKPKGAEFWYNEKDQEGRRIAERIRQEFCRYVGPNRGLKPDKKDYYFVLKNVACPAVLVECGFLSNVEERSKLVNSDYQWRLAWCIASGIKKELKGEKIMASFPDVSDRRWSAGAIAEAVRLGIMGGFEDGTFRPAQALTREQFASAGLRLFLLTSEENRIRNVVGRCTPQTVRIHAGPSVGSGVFVGDKLVLTNAHVVDSVNAVTVKTSQGLFKGEVERRGMTWDKNGFPVAIEPELMIDLATVRITEKAEQGAAWGDGFPVARFATANPGPGDMLVIIGSPLGFDSWASFGIVSRVGQYFIGTDAAINPGNSGGGAFNLSGEFVGIPTEKYTGNYVDSMGSMIRADVAAHWLARRFDKI